MAALLRKLLPFLRTGRWDIAGGGALLIVAAGFELLQPWPIKWLMDFVFGKQPAPAWLGRLWQPFAARDAAGSVLGVCLAILLLALCHRFLQTVSQLLLIRAGNRLVLDLRCRFCEHLHRLGIAFHDSTPVGDTLYRLAYDTQAAQSLLTGALVPSVTGVLLLVGIVAFMVRLDPVLTLAAFAIVPFLGLTIHLFGRRIGEHSERYHRNESALVSAAQESLSAIRAVQAFSREKDTGRRFGDQAGASLEASQRQVRVQLLFGAAVGLVMALGTAGVVWVGADRVLSGRLWPGDILVFIAYLGMLYGPLNSFGQSASVAQSSLAQLQRVFEMLAVEPEIADGVDAQEIGSAAGRIEFRNVSFAYDPGRPVLRDLDFSVAPGMVVALVGQTGTGKSTLASLLLRFYDPTEGAILLDGRDLRGLRLQSLRRQISVVLQDPILFSTTIRENIVYGRPDATEDEVREAARRAQAHEFIASLPDGYDTILSERGLNLSGGQRQRLSIARAFLKDAPILLLDEPTSALDTATEAALLRSLRQLMAGRTTFIIAHRLSTVRHADLILVMDEGRIIERGSHDELMRQNGAYSRLYQSHLGTDDPEAL